MAETVKCARCRCDVLVSALKQPPPFERCSDHRCPLNSPEENARLLARFERAQREVDRGIQASTGMPL